MRHVLPLRTLLYGRSVNVNCASPYYLPRNWAPRTLRIGYAIGILSLDSCTHPRSSIHFSGRWNEAQFAPWRLNWSRNTRFSGCKFMRWGEANFHFQVFVNVWCTQLTVSSAHQKVHPGGSAVRCGLRGIFEHRASGSVGWSACACPAWCNAVLESAVFLSFGWSWV
jgi:hypothetical protein